MLNGFKMSIEEMAELCQAKPAVLSNLPNNGGHLRGKWINRGGATDEG
jgi:hypothetical protein